MKIGRLILVFIFVSCGSRSDYRPDSTSSSQEMTHKLCMVGDMGKGSRAQEIVAQVLRHEKCHGIYFLGDIIYPDGLQSADDPWGQRRFFRYYQELPLLDNRPRLHLIMGNHDYRGNPDAWKKLAAKHQYLHFPHRYYLQKDQDPCFAAIDTNLPTDADQLKWLKQLPGQMKKCRVKIALTHHPLRSSGKDHGHATGVVKNFLEQNVIGKFDYLFSGHEHIISYEGNQQGTELFISGAGGALAKNHHPGLITLETETDSKEVQIKLKTIDQNGKMKVKSYTKNF